MEDIRIVNGYYQSSDGKWYLTDEAKAEQKAMYYSGRLAYDPQDTRHAIGRYNQWGEVVPFQPWPASRRSTQGNQLVDAE